MLTSDSAFVCSFRYSRFLEDNNILYMNFKVNGNKVTSEDMDRSRVAEALAIMSGVCVRVCISVCVWVGGWVGVCVWMGACVCVRVC